MIRKHMNRKEWTGPEQKLLAKLRNQFQIKKCAEILGRTSVSVKRQSDRMGITSPRYTFGDRRQFCAQDVAFIFELRESGFKWREIASLFNSPIQTISVVAKRAAEQGFDAYPMRIM